MASSPGWHFGCFRWEKCEIVVNLFPQNLFSQAVNFRLYHGDPVSNPLTPWDRPPIKNIFCIYGIDRKTEVFTYLNAFSIVTCSISNRSLIPPTWDVLNAELTFIFDSINNVSMCPCFHSYAFCTCLSLCITSIGTSTVEKWFCSRDGLTLVF